MAKAKTVKAKARKAKPKKRMINGVEFAWEVWHLDSISWRKPEIKQFHTIYQEFKTEAQAKAFIKKNTRLIAPVIRHVHIPPMEY